MALPTMMGRRGQEPANIRIRRGKEYRRHAIARRDAIGRAWLTNVNPIIDPVLTLRARCGSETQRSLLAWRRIGFVLSAGLRRQRGRYSGADGQAVAAKGEKASAPQGVRPAPAVRARGLKAVTAASVWATPVQAYFQRTAAGWKWWGSSGSLTEFAAETRLPLCCLPALLRHEPQLATTAASSLSSPRSRVQSTWPGVQELEQRTTTW